MNANEQFIESLAKSQVYQNYEHAFTEATELPLTLRPRGTWQLPLHGKRKEAPFCSLMAGKSSTCAACLQMQEKLAQSAANGPCTMTCAYGLCETAVPVKLGSETLGYLQTGQVLRQKPTGASFQRAMDRAEKLGVKLESEGAREAYFKTPVVSEKKLDSVSSLLAIFADHLSMRSNQIAVQTANAEPPVITKAKQFIDEHHTEELSLGMVAKAVHTSIFYFCKLFRKATGINFTEHVSRVRTEKAKNLLLNPNLRVSEIAFEVGFQSLTHFNRVFKQITGDSPTVYRERLPKNHSPAKTSGASGPGREPSEARLRAVAPAKASTGAPSSPRSIPFIAPCGNPRCDHDFHRRHPPLGEELDGAVAGSKERDWGRGCCA